MPLYKEQGIVLRSAKLGEADKIVTILTQGSGKVRAVAKGIRRTSSKFGARLEPFTHVSLLMYRGAEPGHRHPGRDRGPFLTLRSGLSLIAAGETMLEAADKVAEEHERNVRLFLLLLSGLRALDDGAAATRPPSPSRFLLKLLSLSGFHPSLSACAVCGAPGPHEWFAAGQGGVVCAADAEHDAGRVSWPAVALARPARAARPGTGRLGDAADGWSAARPGRSCTASPSTTWNAGCGASRCSRGSPSRPCAVPRPSRVPSRRSSP